MLTFVIQCFQSLKMRSRYSVDINLIYFILTSLDR